MGFPAFTKSIVLKKGGHILCDLQMVDSGSVIYIYIYNRVHISTVTKLGGPQYVFFKLNKTLLLALLGD